MAQQWNPLQDLMVLQDRMNRLFEDATQRRANTDAGDEFERADWTPAADIYETESGYAIAIDLPGISRDAVEIDVDDNRLIVKGTRNVEQSKHRNERPRGKFVRTFSIPGSVDQGGIGADYKDGVLQIRLPKRQEQKAQRVVIKVS
ncbi:MAG TPA: Hsp20/alpha crystallin family protein [Pyrinomonadaceae bacterium]|jgi:HSP20 family protein|nr:Hsp20/alpha crystallin family protein [Pyrinomonadaceae bacterium]